MKKYNVNVCGTVSDTDTDFEMGFNVTVKNGGSVSQVATSIQDTIDTLSKNGHKLPENEE